MSNVSTKLRYMTRRKKRDLARKEEQEREEENEKGTTKDNHSPIRRDYSRLAIICFETDAGKASSSTNSTRESSH